MPLSLFVAFTTVPVIVSSTALGMVAGSRVPYSPRRARSVLSRTVWIERSINDSRSLAYGGEHSFSMPKSVHSCKNS